MDPVGVAHGKEEKLTREKTEQCKSSISSTPPASFAAPAAPALVSSDANFDFFCDV
jgi:hypothetical protein